MTWVLRRVLPSSSRVRRPIGEMNFHFTALGGWVLGGRILCRGGGPVGYVWDEDEHVELINVILNV